ncbi:MAG: WYL domain-containing protein [Ignavibacteria bacterium]|nr:WYL domain-containing protein [Ignavibacteria bacterium]
MSQEISKELIRQIEIVSMVLEKRNKFSEDDLTDIFKESLPNLRRDFAKIRAMGIPLHSSKRCIDIEVQKIDIRILNKLINTYLALNDTEPIKNLKEISNVFGDKTLSTFVKIVKSINGKSVINFEYEQDDNDQPIRRVVTPIGFFKTNRSFILAGCENDDINKIKYYLIEKIRNIQFLSKKSAHKDIPSMYDFFRSSWGIYPLGKLEKVVLLFDNSCSFIKSRIFINNQEFEDTDDGLLFKADIKISNEFISWILGWGKLVKVIKPESLKNDVLKKAKEVVKVYS